eukprot:766827-Hanusia_phi.AAC.4
MSGFPEGRGSALSPGPRTGFRVETRGGLYSVYTRRSGGVDMDFFPKQLMRWGTYGRFGWGSQVATFPGEGAIPGTEFDGGRPIPGIHRVPVGRAGCQGSPCS